MSYDLLRKSRLYVDRIRPPTSRLSYADVSRRAINEAKKMKSIFCDDAVTVLTIDHGAEGDFRVMRRFLEAEGVKADEYSIGQARCKNDNGYRPITDVSDGVYRKKTFFRGYPKADRKVLLFDDWVKGGSSAVGALVFALENAERIGIIDNGLYFASVVDYQGLAHFALFGANDMHEYRGTQAVLKKISPRVHDKLEADGRFRFLGKLPEDLNRLPKQSDILMELVRTATML